MRTKLFSAAVVFGVGIGVTGCGQLPFGSEQSSGQGAASRETAPVEQESGQQASEEPETAPAGQESEVIEDDEGVINPCQTNALRARFYPDKAANLSAGQADQEPVRVRVANVGAETCSVTGNVRLEFTDESGTVLKSTMVENPAGPSARQVNLATREGAAQDLWWGTAPDPCIEPSNVRVYPPESNEPIELPWNLGAVCGGGKVEHGQLIKD